MPKQPKPCQLVYKTETGRSQLFLLVGGGCSCLFVSISRSTCKQTSPSSKQDHLFTVFHEILFGQLFYLPYLKTDNGHRKNICHRKSSPHKHGGGWHSNSYDDVCVCVCFMFVLYKHFLQQAVMLSPLSTNSPLILCLQRRHTKQEIPLFTKIHKCQRLVVKWCLNKR